MKFDLQSWQISGLLTNSTLLQIPNFQREGKAWQSLSKQLLLDTILKGWKIPKVYLNNPKNQTIYEIVDGQQRIFTILEFLNNKFKMEISGERKNFKELSPQQQKTILDYLLDVEIIRDASDEEVAELYSRLQEGAPLNPAEKIHAITGKLSEFVKEMEVNPFFDKTGFRRKRYGIKGACQQMCFLDVGGIASAKYPNLKEFFESNRDFDDKDTKDHIISVLNFMNKIFPKEEEYLTKAGNVVSIFLICSWLLNQENVLSPLKIYNFFNKFFQDFDKKSKTEEDYVLYNLYLIQSTSGAGSLEIRNEILRRYLYLEEPSLLRSLEEEESIIFKQNMETLFVNRVELIQNLIKEINERAIANGKSIIFDLTAESSQVFFALSRLARNQVECDRLVDLSWKAFYEGSNSGNNLGDLSTDRNHIKDLEKVNIIIKINDLRKVDAHDLEHDRSTYELKIKIASDIRELWTGKKMLQDFDEEDFIVFQHRLESEILDFLQELNESLK